MKNSLGCSPSMWLWIAVTSMSWARKARISGLTSSPVTRKSPVIAALPLPVDWKLIALAPPSGPVHLQPHLHDRVAARHAKLVDAAARRTLDADDLVELGRIQIDSGRSGTGCGGVERRFARRQRRADDRGHFGGIAVAADMHVEGRR